MSQKGSGKRNRKGLALRQVADRFRTNEATRKWIKEKRWPHGPYCPKCGGFNVQCDIQHPSMTYLQDTIDQVALMVPGMAAKRLTYPPLIHA